MTNKGVNPLKTNLQLTKIKNIKRRGLYGNGKKPGTAQLIAPASEWEPHYSAEGPLIKDSEWSINAKLELVHWLLQTR